MFSENTYKIIYTKYSITIEGSMSLQSTIEYIPIFNNIRDRIKNSIGSYTIDLTKLKFMNSSGVTTMSRMMLEVKKMNKIVILKGSTQYIWHIKTLPMLKKIYQDLQLEME